jgi:predicted nucleic acid-binding Zn finger protein
MEHERRIERSRTQNIALIDIISYEEGISFDTHVAGSTGTIYDVKIGSKLFCSCMDYRLHSKKNGPCKHILFILDNSLSLDVEDITSVNINLFKTSLPIHNSIMKLCSLRNIIVDKDNGELVLDHKIEYDPSDTCTICFDAFEDNVCGSYNCKHIFHGHCINMWTKVKSSKTCPLCRSIWLKR